MTISGTSTRELDISRLVLRSWQLAGLITEYQALDPQQTSMSYDFLELIMDELQEQGLALRDVAFETVTLEAGESIYTLAASTLKVIGRGMYITEGADDPADSELVIEPITMAEWHRIGAKASIGTPTRYFQRYSAGLVEVRYWPLPSEAGTVRHMVQKLKADNNDGTKTVDLERGAVGYLLYALAHELAQAKTLPIERCKYLQGIANDKRALLHLSEREEAGFTVEIDHRTSWT